MDIKLGRANYPDEIAVSRPGDTVPRGVVILDGAEFVAVRFDVHDNPTAPEQARFLNLRHAIRWASVRS